MSKPFQIDGRPIGPGHPCYIIAEAGINHQGSLATARQLIDAAKAAGADAVKFQLRHLGQCYPAALLEDPKLGEQGLQYILPVLQECNLDKLEMSALFDHAKHRGITFLCTPWDISSVMTLEHLGVPAYKVGSPDLTNFPLLDRLAQTGKPLIVSTGMSTEEEIKATINRLQDCKATFALLHCVSCYPASPDEINLRFMDRLKWMAVGHHASPTRSGVPVGYSGHELGSAVTLAAVARGASIVERHLTLDRGLPGPDHRASLLPDEFAALVRDIRTVEAALGDGERKLTRGELLNRRNLGKSLVAACGIPAGTAITKEMVTIKGPGLGLSPQHESTLLGQRLMRPMTEGEPFVNKDLLGDLPAMLPSNGQSARIDLPCRWGVVCRFHDFERLAATFGPLGMSVVEFHVSDRDLDADPMASGLHQGEMFNNPWGYDLIVHAPEVCGDKLLDLCSPGAALVNLTMARFQKAIDLARWLAPSFSSRKPKVVIHVGGMTPKAVPGGYREVTVFSLIRTLAHLNRDGVELLVENLPPYPWYFGGRWHGHVLTNPEGIVTACTRSGLGLCLDTSHAALWCNANGYRLEDYCDLVAPHVRHLHVSDAKGVDGEGLQIGEGDIDFARILPPLLARPDVTLVPEVWMGHHDGGAGFRVALERLAKLLSVPECVRLVREARAGGMYGEEVSVD